MFRALMACQIGLALFLHAHWGCAVCHSAMDSVHSSFPGMAVQSSDDHDHQRPLPDAPHDPHSTDSGSHCVFVLRLPTTSELAQHVDVADALSLSSRQDADVLGLAAIAAAESVDPDPLPASMRRAQHQVLLL